jgi:hypothetical protein
VTGIVVLKGRLLSRDILVPLEFIDTVNDDEVVLSLSDDELEQLPESATTRSWLCLRRGLRQSRIRVGHFTSPSSR